MNVDITIYGYVADAVVLHPQCLTPEDETDLDTHPSYWTTLFSWHDDDVHGLTCDSCGDWVFEPYPPHYFDPSDYVRDGRSATCRECGQPAWDEVMHPEGEETYE